MELRHFRYVVALAETLHFGQAAQRLGISQPPLSQQIRQLEEELGAALFHRTKRQVQLTEAGKAFVAEARLVLAQADHAARIAARVSQGETGRLVIAIAGPADAPIFIEILRRFAKRHPNIHVALRNMGTTHQVQALREGRVHAGFLVPPIDDPSLAIENVVRQPAVVALPRKHPLAARSSIPLRALANEPHVMFSRDLAPRYFDTIVSACAREGFTLNVAHEVDNLSSACAIVAAGLGVCFVPASLQQARSRQIVLKPLKPHLSDLDSPLALAYRRTPTSELVQYLVATVKDMLHGRNGSPASKAMGNKSPSAKATGDKSASDKVPAGKSVKK
jgi:DNA-binding transcriptional LysR family regulator